jgi:glycyl-tRNA synthetase
MLSILEDAYQEEMVENSRLMRRVLKIHPLLTPYFVAVIPLSKQLKDFAYQIYLDLLKSLPFNITWEESSSIGKSYHHQDAIGTYYCLTIDFETAQEQTITCRQRDTMKQTRISIDSLKNYLSNQYEEH